MSSAAKERRASPGVCPLGKAPLAGLEHWAGATNAFSVLPVRRCCRTSRIRPFPFSAGTAFKQQHLSAGHPAPPAEAGQELLWGRLRDRLWGWVSRLLPGRKVQGEEISGCCRLWTTPQLCPRPCYRGVTPLPPSRQELCLWQQCSPATSTLRSKGLVEKVLPRYIPAAGGEERG